MFKRYSTFIFLLLIVAVIILIWKVFVPMPMLGSTLLFLILAIVISDIFKKHKDSENARPKIIKDVVMIVITLLLTLFLGGIAAMLANYQVSMRWGEVAGLVSAIAASFVVGYLVRFLSYLICDDRICGRITDCS